MEILRTPDKRFADLPGFPFEPPTPCPELRHISAIATLWSRMKVGS
jgi:hypothetical protein